MFWEVCRELLIGLAPVWVVGLIFIALRLTELAEIKREERRQRENVVVFKKEQEGR